MSVQVGWNLQKEVSDQLSESVVQAKWASVSFDNSHRLFIPKKSRGVYIVSVNSNVFNGIEPFKSFETPAYIGMSTDLRARFENHTAGPQLDALWRRMLKVKKFSTFWFAIFDGATKAELRKTEQSLINVYGSPLNRINSVRMGDVIKGRT